MKKRKNEKKLFFWFFKDSVKALHTCSRFFKYLKTYALYPHKGIYFLKGNKILYKIVVLCFTFK